MVSRRSRAAAYAARDIDYGDGEAFTPLYGVCGVKVWIFKGEILGHDPMAQDRA
jgi:small subunit ribosomal protein S3